jgi:Spy/CpxP family protein refolding chaperone
MTKIKAILVAAFILTLGAGVAAGFLIAHWNHPRSERSRLEADLKLTPEQKEQMDGIWAEARDAMMNRRESLRQERDKAIADLMSEAQRQKYDAVLKEYTTKVAEIPNPFDEAVKRTREILTTEQAVTYDKWMQDQRDRGFGPPRGGRKGPPPDGPPHDGPRDGPPKGPPPPHDRD